MSNKVVICRGISGSGKSTKARELAKGSQGSVICSADDFFVNNGKYNFNPRLLRNAHQYCFKKFTDSLQEGIQLIIIDNTNTQRWEYEKYVDHAQAAGYEVEIIAMPFIDPELAAKRNVHGVPLDVIKKMQARWEN
jgi:predicted kinase